MGALPSRETHQRGLYSHRHGRNRRSEIILIPLTSTFFPSPDCPLFQHLYNARNRRTAKYYLRAPRPVETSIESDYYCNTVRVNDVNEFNKFNQERLETEKLQKKRESESYHAPSGGLNFGPHTSNLLGTVANEGGSHVGCCMGGGGRTKESMARDYDFQSYSDTLEGLYHVLVRETDLCVVDTDQELRDAYAEQVRQQRMELERLQRRSHHKTSVSISSCTVNKPSVNISSANSTKNHSPQPQPLHPPTQENLNSKYTGPSGGSMQLQERNSGPEPSMSLPPFVPNVSLSGIEDISFDAFTSGYVSAMRYMKGKRKHTCSRAVDDNFASGSDTFAASDTKSTGSVRHDGTDKITPLIEHSEQRKYVKHVTSPSAYYTRPIPCVIASRYVEKKPPSPDDPFCVMFEGFYVKIMGMFGLFPATVPMRYQTVSGEPNGAAVNPSFGKGNDFHSESSAGHEPSRRYYRTAVRKEGHPNSDDEIDDEIEIGQHLLKGTMFVDKDVGDQILGNMVMLAAHMYVRQCIEARIQPQYIPMLPFFMRFPLSNIPMLQFVREFRLRLRTLLEAGTAKSGLKSMHAGLSGVNAEDIVEEHNPQQLRSEAEGYLLEDDIPDIASPYELFMDAPVHQEFMAVLRRPTSNTNPMGRIPIMMLSGFNVQHAPLRHPALNMSKRSRQSGQEQPPSPAHTLFPPSGPAKKAQWVSPLRPPLSAPIADPSSYAQTSILPTPPDESDVDAEAYKMALLMRRKKRFRLWVEDGYMCLWASPAYARRACILLAQQLNTTVDGTALPAMRSWRYRGLLHAGAVVPKPELSNDVMIVAEDIPLAGLWQGDVLRCCTAEELLEAQKNQPLTPPGRRTTVQSRGISTSAPASGMSGVAGNPIDPIITNEHSTDGILGSPDTGQSGQASPQGFTPASPGSFWVRGSGGLDDSYTDITEPNLVMSPKMDKQLQQAIYQRAKKLDAAAAAMSRTYPCFSAEGNSVAASLAVPNPYGDVMNIDYREGTLKVEEVILSWMRAVYLQTRKVREDEYGWLCDPSGRLMRLDRYTFFRFEHDGMRFFIGATTRFIGQQHRIEKMLGELNAMEKREQCKSSTDKDKAVSSSSVEASVSLDSMDYLIKKHRCCRKLPRSEKPFATRGMDIDGSQTFLEIVDDDDEDMFRLERTSYDEYLVSDD